jgi:hypothetical protein
VEVGQLRRARVTLDGADFGIERNAESTLVALKRLHR